MDTFIARQPIFDASLDVVGYELLHRTGWKDVFDHGDPDQATVELLESSLLVHRLEDLTGDKLGFVNVTENLLLSDLLRVLPPDRTVIEVLETVRPTPAVVRAVAGLKDAGYRIALDDYEDAPAFAPLIALADFIKVDFSLTGDAEQAALVERHARDGLIFLAEKVETREEFESSRARGYELFQGFFFCKPVTSARRDLPGSKLACLRLIREASRDELVLERIEALIKGEVSLTAKLLRYLNSAHMGVRQEITSIEHALLLLGEREIKRWSLLVAMAGLGQDGPLELVRTCLVRARFLESLAAFLGHEEAALDLFLAGMFSTLDALLGMPISEALDAVDVKPEVARAILGDESWLSHALSLALASERGDVSAYVRLATEFGLRGERVAPLYAEALVWADSVLATRVGV